MRSAVKMGIKWAPLAEHQGELRGRLPLDPGPNRARRQPDATDIRGSYLKPSLL